jgi:hypothetical protein
VSKGRPYAHVAPELLAAQRGAGAGGQEAAVTGAQLLTTCGVEGDVVIAAFGRVLGVWVHHAAGGGGDAGGPAAAGAAGLSTDGGLPERDVDRSLPPVRVLRCHANLVTAVACTRDDVGLPALAYYTGAAATAAAAAPPAAATPAPPVGSASLDATVVVSGDAGGDVVVWRAATLERLAALQLQRKGGREEGVAVLSINHAVVVAGGSLGTVAIWRRRQLRAGGVCRELPPDLVVREAGAHSIVRAVFTPHMHRCQVAAVLTGGGEGDVRLWPVPAATQPTPSPASSPLVAPTISSSGLAGGGAAGAAPLSAPSAASLACRVMRGHAARVTALWLDNSKCVSCALDGAVKVWDVQEPHVGRVLQTFKPGEGVAGLHTVGEVLAVGTTSGSLLLCE